MPSSSHLPDPPKPAHITYRLEPQSGVVVARWYGDMTDAALLSHYKNYYSAPGYDPTCRELVVLTGISANHLTTDGIKKMANLAKRYHRSGYTAIVTESDLSFGLGRMYNVFGPDGTKRIEVFRNLASALEWLGVSETFLEQFESEQVM